MAEDPATLAKKRRGNPNRMPATGHGWGGPAKGFEFKPARQFETSNKYGAIPRDEERIALRKTRSWEMECILHEVAHTSAFDATRIAAAAKLLDRLEGLPTARIEAKISHAAEELTDEQLLEIAKSSAGG